MLFRSSGQIGNSSQQDKLEQDFKMWQNDQQSNQNINVQPVLGICYGKLNKLLAGVYMIVSQNFLVFDQREQDLYTDIIEPISYKHRQ